MSTYSNVHSYLEIFVYVQYKRVREFLKLDYRSSLPFLVELRIWNVMQRNCSNTFKRPVDETGITVITSIVNKIKLN